MSFTHLLITIPNRPNIFCSFITIQRKPSLLTFLPSCRYFFAIPPFKDMWAMSTSMHVQNWAHYQSFISLLSSPSTCLSFLLSCSLIPCIVASIVKVFSCSLVLGVLLWLFFNKGFAFAFFNLFFFAMLSPLKIVLLAILIQVCLQVWECLIMCYEIESNATFLFPTQTPKDKATFQTMLNSLMLHQYILTSTFDLLFEKDLGNWVKTRSTTCYSQFLMSQYNDPRWIEHFKVRKDFFFNLPWS